MILIKIIFTCEIIKKGILILMLDGKKKNKKVYRGLE